MIGRDLDQTVKKENSVKQRRVEIPAIDAITPDRIETATFSMG